MLLASLGLALGLAPSTLRAEPLPGGIASGNASSASALISYVAYAQETGQDADAAPKAKSAGSGSGDLAAYLASSQDAAANAKATGNANTGDLYSYIAGAQQSGTARPIVLAQAAAPKAAPAAPAKAKMVRPAPDDPENRYYVGSEPCKVCHAYLFDEFKLTVMGRMFTAHKETKQGPMECETCHGPASAHVNGGGGRLGGGIRSFRHADPRTSVADSNGVCLGCHENGDRTYWKGSTHENRDVACTDCHTVMRKLSPRYQLAKGNVMDTCFQCHKDKRAAMLRTAHMPLIEGKLSCTSCHNPHGSASSTGLLKEVSVNDTCYQCHADKRGPFLWEHPPVRENCLNCHDPHGSVYQKMLIVTPQRLCQRCHTNPHNQPGMGASFALQGPVVSAPGSTATLGGAASNLNKEISQGCLNCHTNIHGSNDPSGSRWHR